MSNSSSRKTHSSGNNSPPRRTNPFQKSGSDAAFEVTETKEACVMRVNMPGCPESDLAYWIDSNNVHFFGDEPVMPQFPNSGRRYGGSIVLNPETYDVKEAKAKLLNGVLWITVPKIPGTNANIHVIQ